MKITDILNKIGNNSKSSQKEIASTSHKKRQSVLKICANNIKGNMKNIIDANKQDVDDAKKSNLKTSYVDRLRLDSERILAISMLLESIDFGDIITGLTLPISEKTGMGSSLLFPIL